MYFVYVLQNEKNGRRYVGSTNNLNRRLSEHNRGSSKYTKATRPFKLVYSEQYDSRTAAVHREGFLKSGKGRELLDELI